MAMEKRLRATEALNGVGKAGKGEEEAAKGGDKALNDDGKAL